MERRVDRDRQSGQALLGLGAVQGGREGTRYGFGKRQNRGS